MPELVVVEHIVACSELLELLCSFPIEQRVQHLGHLPRLLANVSKGRIICSGGCSFGQLELGWTIVTVFGFTFLALVV